MAISLAKGDRFNLTKKEPSLSKIMVGLGWELRTGDSVDLDSSVFMLGNNRKLPRDENFIFYNNLKSPDGAIQHTGDNRTGAGDDDDEIILCNLPLIDENVSELLFAVTIHDAFGRNHKFGLLKDAYIRVYDVESKREVLRYDIDANNSDDTDMEFGKLVKKNNEWHFVATGEGATHGLQGFVDIYA